MKKYFKGTEELKADYHVYTGEMISETGDRKLKMSDHVLIHKTNIEFNGKIFDNEFIERTSISHKTGRYSTTYTHLRTGFKCGDSHKKVISHLAEIGVLN